jgi:hypothetical protein|tara:strand:- start:2846 stop:3586 length:741 start_codon:yes stop_codon:yes gene_type:complete
MGLYWVINMGVPVIIGVCQQASGGSPTPGQNGISVATTTGTGNFDNAVKFGFWDFATNSYAYSNGIYDGSTSVLSTGTNPTRTIQTQNVLVSDYQAAYNTVTADVALIIGGAIRTTTATGFVDRGRATWEIGRNGTPIISASLTNAGTNVIEVQDTYGRTPSPDRTIMNTGQSNPPYGIYDLRAQIGTSYQQVFIRNGKSGVAATSCPVAGDNLTIRLTVFNQIDNISTGQGQLVTTDHDLVINFV